jgi:nitrogen fixation NifU-like protein
MAYSDRVIDHYNNPRNVGTLDKTSGDVGTGLVGAPECGDVMRLQIRVNPETQVIEEAKFKTFGCGSAIASSSLATDGSRVAKLKRLSRSRTPTSSRNSRCRQ